MRNNLTVNNEWIQYELYIENIYGFNQLSISDFIKSSVEQSLSIGNKKILDLGCGSGRHAIYLSKCTFDLEIYASDIDCKAIETNTKILNFQSLNISEHSFTNIPYDNEFFDAVICTSTLHHAVLEDIKKVIAEVQRVLKPNGYFIFDILSKNDKSYGLGTEIESNTFLGGRKGEEEIPHHYTNEVELESLLYEFSNVEINKSIYKFIMNQIEYESKCFDVIAIK